MRVVFDTNIFISALVFPGSVAEQALLQIIMGKDRLLITKPILDELLGVLARKFSRDKEALSRVSLWISEIAAFVTPRERIHELKDEADNRILECALAGNAEALVTGDKKILELGQIKGIPIISLKDYLKKSARK